MNDATQVRPGPTMNWNAAVGSISGLSLSAEAPVINLHSYKFYCARAIEFAVRRTGVEVRPTGVAVTWHPHKVESRIAYPDFTMHLDAFFVDAEVIAVRYALASSIAADVEVAITGTARNGVSNDKFYDFRGRVERCGSGASVEQEVDIPDYRSHPMGPLRQHTHHLLWLIDAPESITVSPDVVEVPHPERIELKSNDYAVGVNRSNYWRIEKRFSLSPSAGAEGHFFIGTRWLGPAKATSQDHRDLRQSISTYRRRPLAEIEGELKTYWNDLLAKLPPVKKQYQDNTAYRTLYVRAWACVLQNICGSLVTSRKTIKGPTVLVGKVCSNGFGPAQWETSLAGFLVSFIDPDVGIRIIESVLNSVEVDGFIPEDLIFNRDVKLSSHEPFMLESIYLRTGDIACLERNYDTAFKQLVCHIKHPGFDYLSSPVVNLLLDDYYSLLALRRIAVVIGKGPEELQWLREFAEDVATMLEFLMKDKPLGQQAYVAIGGYLDGEKAQEAVRFIREHMITPPDRCFLYGSPDGQRDSKDDPKAFAMNGWFLHFILGLERLGADDLLDTVVAKTFDGLTRSGDFFECYYVNGKPHGNGPMSIFGAFGWIWSLMEKQRPVHARQAVLWPPEE